MERGAKQIFLGIVPPLLKERGLGGGNN